MLQTEGEILAILVGQRRDRQRDAGQVDTLLLDQESTVDDLAFHVFAAHCRDLQLNASIRKQNSGARTNFPSQTLKCRGDQSRGTRDIAGSDDDLRTGLQLYRSVAAQTSGADFRALQILKDADGPVFLLGGTS